jgi:plastocyanin
VSGKIEKKTIFDVTLQAPGKENDKKISLKKPGTYTVQCAIHPKMKLEVVVEK